MHRSVRKFQNADSCTSHTHKEDVTVHVPGTRDRICVASLWRTTCVWNMAKYGKLEQLTESVWERISLFDPPSPDHMEGISNGNMWASTPAALNTAEMTGTQILKIFWGKDPRYLPPPSERGLTRSHTPPPQQCLRRLVGFANSIPIPSWLKPSSY